MTDEQVDHCLNMLKYHFPDIYENLKLGRDEFMNKINEKSEIKK